MKERGGGGGRGGEERRGEEECWSGNKRRVCGEMIMTEK